MQKLKLLSSSITDLFKTTTAGVAAKQGSIEIPQPVTIAERYPLHNACVFGNSVDVEFFLSCRHEGASEEDDNGRIPLHYSVQLSDSYISKLLIKCGANVDACDYVESSPSHFAAREGNVHNALLLLQYGADFCARDKMGRTAVDVAAEEGHYDLIKLLIEQGCVDRLVQALERSVESRIVTTPLHLASRNGHVQIVHLLVNAANFPLNFASYHGSALHEAIKNNQLQVVRLLLHHGIKLSLTDHNGATALELVNLLCRHNPVSSPLILELIQEARNRVYGIAVADYNNTSKHCVNGPLPGLQLSFKTGQIVWILGYKENLNQTLFLRGITFAPSGNSCCGFFPKRAVRILNHLTDKDKKGTNMGYKKLSGSCKTKMKKVDIPMVPNSNLEDMYESTFNSSNTTDYHTDSGSNTSDRHSYYTNSSAPLPEMSPTPSRAESFYDGATVASFPDDEYPDAVGTSTQSSHMQHANSFGVLTSNCASYNTDAFRNRSVLPDMPSSSSISSQFSGHSSSCLTDGYSGRATATLSNSTSRSSNVLSPGCSFSSNKPATATYRMAQVIPGAKCNHRVARLLSRGIGEVEIIADWLSSIRLPHYLSLFCQQGYDLASIARATPQDLIAIGVGKPDHRREMIQDIHNWNITDGYPSFIPRANGIRDFMNAIGLTEYIDHLESQNLSKIQDLEKLTLEDFEEIGIRKLGHMKRLGIAIKKLKTNREARQQKDVSATDGAMSSSSHSHYPGGTLTSRSTSALGDQMHTFDNHSNYGTLRHNTRSSLPGQQHQQDARHRPIVPVMPTHHVPQHSPRMQTDQKEYEFIKEEPRKPRKLNLMMRDQILSKLDDIENDVYSCIQHCDDLPPSPAPFMYHSALERLYTMKLPGNDGFDSSTQQRNSRNSSTYSTVEELNDLGQMLQELTDELDAKLHTSTTV